MKKLIIVNLIMLLALSQATAQDHAGIQFVQHLNWSQVLAKAKAEHKSIFVDCYATWCAPCKQMEQTIYPQKEVGDVFNRDFISVKLQMDRTNGDNDETKTWYPLAAAFEKNLTISAYPTFLFFDSSGEPTHKITGILGLESFVQMAKDAQNTAKQYYANLKNFKPGKIDTVEEKGLINEFYYSDKKFALQIALDYLHRIRRTSLKNKDLRNLMLKFSDSPEMKQFIIRYVQTFELVEFAEKDNLTFITQLHPDPVIDSLAKAYILRLTTDWLYTKDNLNFLAAFTETPSDPGFPILYHAASKINAIMQDKDFAQSNIEYVINKSTFKSVLDSAKKGGPEPDFSAIAKKVIGTYGKEYAERIVINGKVAWYQFLVNKKKQIQYWPQLIDAKIEQVRKFRYDTLSRNSDLTVINNIAYYYFFLQSNDPEKIKIGMNWMKEVVAKAPNRFDCLDTYADLLYKAGNIAEALSWEERACQIAINQNDKKNTDFSNRTIEKMKIGEPIWTDKAYTGN